jgi:peptide/nickel transport system ATP-binding protein
LDSVLSVSDLCLSIRQNPDNLIVNRVSFEINPGETLAIVGESGSGKTLTALSIMGLLPSDARMAGGEICLKKKNGNAIRIDQLGQIELRALRGHDMSMIFQEPGTSLNPLMRCGDQIAETIMLHQNCAKPAAYERTLSLLKEVQISDPERVYDAYPHQLSGGQKQRIMIAMAVSSEPAIILADEPTSALDASVQKGILELLKSVQQKYKIGILFISHDLDLVRGFADHVLVMVRGQIVENKPVDELFSHPAHPYTQGLLSCKPGAGVRLRQLPTVADFLLTNSSQLNSLVFKEENIIKPEARKERLDRILGGLPHVSVQNLSVYFNGKNQGLFRNKQLLKAVDRVSFEVFKGETLGVVGESGSGKTSLSRSLLRLIEPESGRIRIGNLDLTSLSKKALRTGRKRFQLVFQDPYASLNPLKSIGSALMEPLEIQGIGKNYSDRKNKVIRFLEMVGLQEDHFGRLPHAFSGGQRQRICIARALIVEPEFLILDEPVSSLDVSVQAQVINLLTRLKEKMGFTCIFISHDLNLVRYVSDRIMVMKEGKIVEIAEADHLFINPQSEYTRSLIDSLPGRNKPNFKHGH